MRGIPFVSRLGRTIRNLFLCLKAVFFLYVFASGAEVTISYNKERARQAPATLWSKTIKMASYIGDFKQAIWR